VVEAPVAAASVAIGTDAIAAPVPADATATIDTRVDAPTHALAAKTATAQVGVPAPMPQPASTAGSIGGALFALVLVIGLILLLGWLAKRMPGLGGARSNSALRVVGSLALGPRDRVVVVAVGDTQLLLGVGSGGTRTLHTLTEPLPVAPESKAAPAFAQLLAQHFGKKA
jgi:flagellar protein FliO/FliZ